MQHNCHQCQAHFDITPSDLAFYEKVSPVFNGKKELIPPPTLCPDCRQRRRWAVRNENRLFRRTCNLTGHMMISLYDPESPHTVFSEDVYHSNQWDPMAYGRKYDFSRPFFDQFHDLLLAVPRRGLQQDGTNENCTYTTYGTSNKNCYMTFACFNSEDVYHSTRVIYLKDASDCLLCVRSELVYECVNCTNCYNCSFCKDTHNCQDSLLLDHCQSCKSCIACKNLRNKEYHIYNKPASPEEFRMFKERLFQDGFDEERAIYDQWKIGYPYPYAHILQSENCTGDYVFAAKNCHVCFEIHLGAEDDRYCQICGANAKDCMDCTISGLGGLFYETIGVGPGQQCTFSYFAGEVTDSLYCSDFHHSDHCFGCVGIDRKSYCILNTQYTKREYEEFVPRIIAHMRTTGEYGEFFPMRVSTFPYNDTIAQELFPMTKEVAASWGLRWQEKGREAVGSERTSPDGEDIMTCEATGRPFRITKQEHVLLGKLQLPLPRLHPEERHRRRMARTNPYHLWNRQCAKCHKPIATSYSPERPEIVYCESCYLKEVY